jgi:hypothetical protein
MQGLADAIRTFYEEFILRDVLAYVTPAAFVVGYILKLYYGSVSVILAVLKDIPVAAYILVFGGLFIIGYGLQNLGEILRIIDWHQRANDRQHIHYLKEFHLRKQYRDANKDQNDQKQPSNDGAWLERTRERMVVKKNMCGTAALALLIVFILAILQKLIPASLPAAVLVLSMLLVVSLLRGHIRQRRAQRYWEDEVVNVADSANGEAQTTRFKGILSRLLRLDEIH